MLLAVISSEDMVVFNNTCYWFVKKGGGDQDNLGYEAATKGGGLIIIQDLRCLFIYLFIYLYRKKKLQKRERKKGQWHLNFFAEYGYINIYCTWLPT
jgi:hypothetical protein